jgi:PAS domain S-box-containing protein
MTAMGLARRMRRRPWLGYPLGLLLALAGLGARQAFFPGLMGYPFIPFLPMIVIAAFLAGFGPAMLCTAASVLLARYFLISPAGSFNLEGGIAIAAGLFVAAVAMIVLALEYSVRAFLRLELLEARRRRDLERQMAARTQERDRLWSLSQDPFLITDRDGVWLAASPAWERILGWPLDELVGKTSAAILYPDDRQATEREREYNFGGGASFRFQNRYRAADGHYRWLSWTAVAEGDRLYCVARDVTQMRETARQLEQTQEALVQSQKIEAMGKVTGGVAHDFNNLLTPILGGLDLLQRRGLPDAKAEQLVGGALQAAERARTLVQRLLAFARRQPLQVVPVDLARCIESLRELVESTLGPRIDLQVTIPQALPHVLADAAQLEMAVLNLAVNARDAMPDGGSLTISAAPLRLAGGREGLPDGHYVRLTVADTGIGMSPQVLERAIEPFYSTKGVGRGTGLGLSMVHGLMGQLGGALRIESTPGEGTRIHLWMRAAEESERPAAKSAQTDEARGSAGTALLVDDEEVVRTSVAAMLADLGYQVVEADSAAAALARLDGGERFDLIVTDHLMAGMTGTELARAIRRREPDQKIVIISGYSELDEIASDFPRLAKPFKQDDLGRLLRG